MIIPYLLFLLMILGGIIVIWWEDKYHGEEFCNRCGCKLVLSWHYDSTRYDPKTGIGTSRAYKYMQCPKARWHFSKATGYSGVVLVRPHCKGEKNDTATI